MNAEGLSSARGEAMNANNRRGATAGYNTRARLNLRKTDETQGLKTESMIRRNKLTLEHIMAERGKHVAEDKVIAQLHRELRDLEAKEKTGEIITIVRGAYGNF